VNLFLQALSTANSLCSSDLKLASEQLKVIEQKIADKTKQLSEPTTFAGVKQLTRHEMDLEKAVTRDRDSTKVFCCLVREKSCDSVDPDHPINHLDQIWKDVLSSRPTCRKRKRKQTAAAVASDDASCEVTANVSCSIVLEETVSKSLQHEEPAKQSPNDTRLQSSLSSDNSKQRKCDIELVPSEVIERYRLSIEQIKQLPRFQNYTVGTPSPVRTLIFSDFNC